MGPLLEHSLPGNIRRKLVDELNADDKWKCIVSGLTTYRIPAFLNANKVKGLEKKGISPAEWLLEELFNRMWSFDEFCSMLREFNLLEELALLTPAEPMVIETQPGDGEEIVRIERGEQLHLTCLAYGVPRPSYQWYCENTAISGQTSSDLIINSFSEEQVGIYWCLLKQEINGHLCERVSSEVMVDLMAVQPQLLMDLPRVRSVPRGQTLVLTVQANGYPPPRFEWYRTVNEEQTMPNVVLDETSCTLEVKNANSESEGLYCCRVYNEAGEIFSSSCGLSVFEHPPDYIASTKVALLIGNEDYQDEELQGLTAPSNDVATLTPILTRLGFHVIPLHNLTRIEMYNAFRWFCRLLPANAYAFFYFAGHGFSKLASKFMMPIDCPKDEIKLCDCLCDEHLTQILAQGEQLQLLVMLFDCCLVESRDLSIGRTEFEHDLGNCNIVLGTATRNHQNAYESERDANGLFVNHLQAHLEENMPIIEVLWANQRDFREKQQQPTIFFSGADNCSLTDPVLGDPQIEEMLALETEFSDLEQQIHFRKISKSFTLKIRKHKNCFLNSVDMEFPENFRYNFSVEVNPQDVSLKVENKVVTILNVQRVKCSMCITVIINGLRQTEEGFISGPHDSCQFNLDCPIINKELWRSISSSDASQLFNGSF